MKLEISNEIKEMIGNNKKIAICETFGVHNENSHGYCKNCGAYINVYSGVPKDERGLQMLFYMAIHGRPLEFYIWALSIYEEDREFRLSKYIEVGKYLIDTAPPDRTLLKHRVQTAFIFGYVPEDNSLSSDEIKNWIDTQKQGVSMLTRYTVNRTRDRDFFRYRKYDREQIDELMFYDENIPLGNENFLSSNALDSEYFSIKMTELYKAGNFKKLKHLISLVINHSNVNRIDSRFIPFLSDECLCRIKDVKALAEYKDEIIDSYKYFQTTNNGLNAKNIYTKELAVTLSQIYQRKKGKPKMVNLSKSINEKLGDLRMVE